jgi:hypothetical protein
VKRRLVVRSTSTPSNSTHSRPVRVCVPTGISRQAKPSPIERDQLSGLKIVPYRASQ